MSEEEKKELAKAIVELIYTNGEVRSTIIKLVCACPNVVTEI